MDDTTGTTGAEQPEAAPAEAAADPNAAPPSYADVKPERLVAQYEAAKKQFDKIREKPISEETLAAAREQHQVMTDIAAEMQARKEQNDKLREELSTLGDVILPEVSDAPATVGDGIDEAAPAVEGDVAVEPEKKELIAASVGAPTAAQVAAARDPQTAAAKTASEPARPKRAWVAAAGMGKYQTAGLEAAMTDLGQAIMDNFKVGQGMGKSFTGTHEAVLASLPGFTEDMGELLGDHNGRVTNDRLIAEAQEAFRQRQAGIAPPPKLAAICDPLDIIREISTPGRSRATPFRDSLPFRGAGRLGFQFTRSLSISDVTGGLTHSGVGAWSDADQDSVDPDTEATWKPVYDVTCGSPAETRAQELTWGLRFEESTDLSSPERVADALDALMTAEARRSEGYLIRRYDQMASGYAWGTPNLGGVPDIAEIISRLWEKAMYAERIDLGQATLALPPGFISSLRLDKLSRGFDAAPATDIMAELRAALPDGITIIQLRDLSDNADLDPDTGQATSVSTESIQGGGDLTLTTPGAGEGGNGALTHDQCQAYRLRLYWPDQFLAYSTGRTDTGVLRSPELIRQNQSIMFGREWLGLAKPGSVPAFYVNVTLLNSGIRMGMLTADGVDCSS